MLNKQLGVSMIELLIGTFIGLLVLAGMIRFLSGISNYSTKSIKTVRLDYELQTALNLMASDIRRAGFWNSAANMISTGLNSNPFMAGGTDISIPSTSCILLTYDANKDGALPSIGTGTSDERFGYRLSGGAVQTRATTDGTFSCTGGTWENVTNPDLITVTNLTFTLTTTPVYLTIPATTQSIVLRNVSITVTGNLNSDATIVTTLSANIRVRNDKYQP